MASMEVMEAMEVELLASQRQPWPLVFWARKELSLLLSLEEEVVMEATEDMEVEAGLLASLRRPWPLVSSARKEWLLLLYLEEEEVEAMEAMEDMEEVEGDQVLVELF
jgi:hypothetical protein